MNSGIGEIQSGREPDAGPITGRSHKLAPLAGKPYIANRRARRAALKLARIDLIERPIIEAAPPSQLPCRLMAAVVSGGKVVIDWIVGETTNRLTLDRDSAYEHGGSVLVAVEAIDEANRIPTETDDERTADLEAMLAESVARTSQPRSE